MSISIENRNGVFRKEVGLYYLTTWIIVPSVCYILVTVILGLQLDDLAYHSIKLCEICFYDG